MRGSAGRVLAVMLLGGLAAGVQAAHAEDAAGPECAEGRSVAAGLCLTAEGTLDTFGVVAGGVHRGVAAIGRASLGLDADLDALAGLEGWTARVTFFGIYGRQPTPTLVGGLAAVSSIEALSTFRLSEFWAQRAWEGIGSIRFGRLAADTEFAVADTAALLVSGTFGWPLGLSSALPFGGPAYPLSALGLRVAGGDPDNGTGLRLGVFAGRPSGLSAADTEAQRADRYGFGFSLGGGAFAMLEGVVGASRPDGAPAEVPRPWVLKAGGWFHTATFESQRFDTDGLSLANPDSTGVPRNLRRNYGGYGIGEATLWREGESSLGVFGRAFWAPGDRNLVIWQGDAGLAWRGPFGRAADTLSVGVSTARIGGAARGLDRDRIAFGADRPVRDYETLAEVNYDLGLVPGHLSVRPVAQWVIHPAAREPDDRYSATRRLPNAVLLGLRLVAAL